MLLGGLQKTTLIDYPGKVACTLFCVGCNFSCPFCHNKDLVTLKLFRDSGIEPLKLAAVLEFLEKRRGILDGVCLTGGEPTIQPDLVAFIRKIKTLGYSVKLDTNGSNPKVLEKLIKERLLDYIAMDIKSNFDDYQSLINIKYQISNIKNNNFLAKIKKSISLILKSGIDFEFRTTIVPGLHTKENLVKLAKQLSAISFQQSAIGFPWFLQPFRPRNCLDPKYLKLEPFSLKEIKEIELSVKKIIPETKLRGNNNY